MVNFHLFLYIFRVRRLYFPDVSLSVCRCVCVCAVHNVTVSFSLRHELTFALFWDLSIPFVVLVIVVGDVVVAIIIVVYVFVDAVGCHS